VVVGKIGDDLRMDYTAVGDTTNLAAQLQQMAHGTVMISAATHQHVAASSSCVIWGGAVKGRAQSTPLRCCDRIVAERALTWR